MAKPLKFDGLHCEDQPISDPQLGLAYSCVPNALRSWSKELYLHPTESKKTMRMDQYGNYCKLTSAKSLQGLYM